MADIRVPVSEVVRILRPSLDDYEGTTVLRGVLGESSLGALRLDFYQRERLATTARRAIVQAIEGGEQLPDIQCGMRGDRFQIDDDGDVLLLDPVFIIDGRQRRDTILEYRERHPDTRIPRLGAIVYFNTDARWERERFHALNSYQLKVAPSVLLRNRKEESAFLTTLYALSNSQRDGVLFGRVCWSQNKGRGELITAVALASVTIGLHVPHLILGRSRSVNDMPVVGQRLVSKIGLPMLRANVTAYWELIDHCWGVRHASHNSAMPQVRHTFTHVLARILADHEVFWSGPGQTQLKIPTDLRAKFKKLDVYDPEVLRLASSSGKAHDMLYYLMVEHLNSGKRTRRLVSRRQTAPIAPDELDGEEDAA